MFSHKNSLVAVLLSAVATGSAYGQITESAAKDATSYTDSVISKMPEPSLLGGFGAFDTPVDKNSVNFTNLNQKGSLGKLGVTAMNRCKSYIPTGNVAEDQECAGVNYMANNCLQTSSTQNQIITGVSNVPTASSNCSGTYGSTAGVFELSPKDRTMISNFGKAVNTVAASTSLCSEVERIVRPATTELFNCIKNTQYNEVSCTQDLNPECSLQGGDLASYSTNPGSLNVATITPSSTPGVYNYLLYVAHRCGTQASGSISFEVQNIAWGSSITLTVSGLDDSAAIGVNRTTVYAGHPNSGVQYYGSFFPNTEKGFQIGYSWIEDGQAHSANTKLLDYCPGGYAPTAWRNLEQTARTGGFFCNSEGKFLMNRREGNGDWAGTIPSSEWPLVTGTNTIELYWGTSTSRRSCGNVTVQGVITNKVPTCSKVWTDNCSPYEASAGATLANPE